MLTLPADIWHLICEELSNREDFTSLFNCAISGKTLVGSALLWLYRIQSQAPITGSELDSDEAQKRTWQARINAVNKTTMKWALQWKSMIRSSLGHTAYPYCLYIRSLDLANLADLLDDPYFRDTSLDTFFKDDMAVFLKSQDTPMKQKMRGAKRAYQRLDIPRILERVGESITRFVSESASQNRATVAVEELAGQIPAGVLPTWASRLAKLKILTLFDGSILNASVGTMLKENCFFFDDLTIYTCFNNDADHDLASFFESLTRNTLKSFAALGAAAVGPETLLSLNCHSKSLRKLKLNGLRAEAIKNISFLQECTALDSLEIADAEGFINLEETQNDVYLEVIAWLGRCTNLRELILQNMLSGPAILTQVCLTNAVRLRKLHVAGYTLNRSQEFHKALTHQTSLEWLQLKADPEGAFRDDIDTLVASVSQLKNLKYLNLLSTSDYFRTFDILSLVPNLESLEELWSGGYDVTDDLWHGMANLHNLRALNIHAVTSFTFDGILAYISTLQDSNQGMQLSVLSQATDHPFTEDAQFALRDAIAKKVNGKFDFVMYREADSESESLSD